MLGLVMEGQIGWYMYVRECMLVYGATSIIQTHLATMPTWGYQISEIVWITEILNFSLLFQSIMFHHKTASL